MSLTVRLLPLEVHIDITRCCPLFPLVSDKAYVPTLKSKQDLTDLTDRDENEKPFEVK